MLHPHARHLQSTGMPSKGVHVIYCTTQNIKVNLVRFRMELGILMIRQSANTGALFFGLTRHIDSSLDGPLCATASQSRGRIQKMEHPSPDSNTPMAQTGVDNTAQLRLQAPQHARAPHQPLSSAGCLARRVGGCGV